MTEENREDMFRAVLTGRMKVVEDKMREVDQAVAILVDRIRSVTEMVETFPEKYGGKIETKIETKLVPKYHFMVDPKVVSDRSRTPNSVALRWGIWKAMHKAGLGTREISQRFKVNRHTVEYAMRQGWKPSNLKLADSWYAKQLKLI